MSRLYEPLTLGDLHLDNRIIVAPMCQYSAEAGSATDWHVIASSARWRSPGPGC